MSSGPSPSLPKDPVAEVLHHCDLQEAASGPPGTVWTEKPKRRCLRLLGIVTSVVGHECVLFQVSVGEMQCRAGQHPASCLASAGFVVDELMAIASRFIPHPQSL